MEKILERYEQYCHAEKAHVSTEPECEVREISFLPLDALDRNLHTFNLLFI